MRVLAGAHVASSPGPSLRGKGGGLGTRLERMVANGKGTSVWSPHLSKDINKLEAVQRFALRMCHFKGLGGKSLRSTCPPPNTQPQCKKAILKSEPFV